VATATLDELIERTRIKANVLRSDFATDPEIIVYLNEARKQLRELIVTADDSYYQATMADFSIGAAPTNLQALPSDFWKLRGLDAFAGDSLRQQEVYAREFRNRFDPGIGYYFGGDGNSIVVCGQSPEQGNPFRVYYTPKPRPLAARVPGNTRSITPGGGDGTNAGSQLILGAGQFTAGDVGALITIAGNGDALDGTRTIVTVVNATHVTTQPPMPPSLSFGAATVSLVDSDAASRTFAIANPDLQSSGYFTLQNGNFGPSDVGSFLTVTLNAPNDSLNATYTILDILDGGVGPTAHVTPAVAGVFSPLVGTASVSRQPGGTDNALDLTEDNFSEYFPVRAGMAIARRKRQDTLVQQLQAEREAIEERIASLSRMRQSEPQQAPVLWGHRTRYNEDWEI
jgi:hypothetical protein